MNRKFDELGRIVIPKEMRNKLGLKNGDEATIELIDDKIVISNKNKTNDNSQRRIDKVIEYIEENSTEYWNENYTNLLYRIVDADNVISILKGEE